MEAGSGPIGKPLSEAAGAVARRFGAALRDHRAGRLPEAIAGYRHVLRLAPGHASAWINLGVALRASGHAEEAVACLRRGVQLKPDDAGVCSNLGNALRAVGRLREASTWHRRALALDPGRGQAHYNFALACRDLGELDEALAHLARAEAAGYRSPELHWDWALTLLLAGDLKRGFIAYEWRWKLPDNPPRFVDAPRWQGEDLADRALLVHAEQGFGDTIQFVRYLPLLASRGGKLLFECQTPLLRLFRDSPALAGVELFPRDAPLPRFDFQAPLLSLPRLLGTTADSIPAAVPYLTPPRGKRRPASNAGLRVGIAWAGKPSHRNDRNRSVDLARFRPLLDLPGIRFVSLQQGAAAAAIAELDWASRLEALDPPPVDFAETAAAMMQLDLVITVDTAVAHLAGALARPVWTLLPFAADWRWQTLRTDSPWYQTMRLFRQARPGDWTEVFQRVHAALRDRLVSR